MLVVLTILKLGVVVLVNMYCKNDEVYEQVLVM